jgi:deoxyadenosine/deoxycytidine kinase
MKKWPHWISIIGPIGAGKTTLAKTLAELLGFKYEGEEGEDELDDYYKDPVKNSCWFQFKKLTVRFEKQQQITSYCLIGKEENGVVQDEGIYEDIVFARAQYEQGYMSEKEYKTYLRTNKVLLNCLRGPDVVVFLDATPEQSAERIKARNRSCESDISMEYLRLLYKLYLEEIEKIPKTSLVIKIKYDSFRNADEMAKIIKEEYYSNKNVKKIGY